MLFGGASSWLIYKLAAIRRYRANATRARRNDASFVSDILFDQPGRERYVRINMLLTGAGIITWLPGARVIGVWLFVWWS